MTLSRKKHTMPKFVREALKKEGVMKKYEERPPYQQNDYIGWITRAARDETKERRLKQMISELKKGNVYMKMDWKSKKK